MGKEVMLDLLGLSRGYSAPGARILLHALMAHPQVWFIVAESIASACYGVAMHVGEKLSPQEVCGSFEGMYRIFFKYLELGDRQRHFRFAYVWNEVGDEDALIRCSACRTAQCL